MPVRVQVVVAGLVVSILAASELALDLAGATPDQTLQDAFRLALGAMLTLLAVHVANGGSSGQK